MVYAKPSTFLIRTMVKEQNIKSLAARIPVLNNHEISLCPRNLWLSLTSCSTLGKIIQSLETDKRVVACPLITHTGICFNSTPKNIYVSEGFAFLFTYYWLGPRVWSCMLTYWFLSTEMQIIWSGREDIPEWYNFIALQGIRRFCL